MKDKAEELRKQFQQENSRDDLFTVFHVKWLEQKLIDQQSKEEAKERCDKAIEYLNPTLDHSYFKAIRIASGIDD